MRLLSKPITTVITLIIVSIMLITPVLAVDNQQSVKVFTPQKSSKIALGNGNFAEVISANMLPTEAGNLLAVTLSYQNNGSTDLDLIDYWVRFATTVNTNASYTVKIAPADLKRDRIPAKTSSTITYYSTISSNIKLDQMKVQVIKWDFNQLDTFERTLGEAKLSAQGYQVPESQTYEINTSGMKLDTYLEKGLISKNEKFYNINFKYQVTNKGNSTLTLPQFQYYIMTSEGILYALNASSSNAATLAPKVNKEITLRGNIPIEIKETGWKFVVALPITDTDAVLPIATYSIPKSTVDVGTDFNKEYSFTTEDGLYNVKVNSLYRSPLEDEDIIAANITIENTDTVSLPVPNLTGKIVLDSSITTDAEVIIPDKVIAIKPGNKVNAYMYSLIPYTYDFDDVRLVFQESKSTGDNEEENTLLEISGKNPITDLNLLALGAQFRVDNVGSQSSYKVRETRTYTGASSKKFVVQLDVDNLEKRAAEVIKFNGYIKLADGNVFIGEVSEIKNKVVPGGKALLEISAVMPTNYDLSNATLIMGETVESKGSETPNSELTAYVNPIEMQLPADKIEQDHLAEIDLHPYKLSISKVKSQIQYGSGELILDFNYELEKEALVQFNGEKKNVIIEVVDEKNDISFTNEYSLEVAQESSSAFLLGNHEGRFKETDQELIYKIQRMNNNYKLNVYEQSDSGFKKLLASKEIRWFGTSD